MASDECVDQSCHEVQRHGSQHEPKNESQRASHQVTREESDQGQELGTIKDPERVQRTLREEFQGLVEFMEGNPLRWCPGPVIQAQPDRKDNLSQCGHKGGVGAFTMLLPRHQTDPAWVN